MAAVTRAKAPFAPQHFIKGVANQFAKVSTGTYVIILNGGSQSEVVDLDITPVGFTSVPIGIAQVVDTGGQDPKVTFARYTVDGSSSTTARIVFFRTDGGVLTSGAIRIDVILWNN